MCVINNNELYLHRCLLDSGSVSERVGERDPEFDDVCTAGLLPRVIHMCVCVGGWV